MKYIKKDVFLIGILEYLFVLMLIFSTNSIFLRQINTVYSSFITGMLLFSIILLGIYGFFILCKGSNNLYFLINRLFIYYILCIIIIVYNYSISSINFSTVVRIGIAPFFLFIYIYYLYQNNIVERVLKKFVFLCVCLSLLSLVLWLAAILGTQYNMSVTINWGRIKAVPGLFGLQYFPQGSVGFLGVNILRNTGVFTEAPMYSWVLSIALIVYIYLIKNSKIISYTSFLLIITNLSTTSTTGLLMIIFTLLGKFFINVSKKFKVLIILFIPFIYYVIEIILASKATNSTVSVSLRADDFQAGVKAWLLHPIVGNGITNSTAYYDFIDFSRFTYEGGTGYSLGTLNILFGGGILYFLMIQLIPLTLYGLKSKDGLIVSLLLFTSLAVTIVDSTYLYIVIISFMYMKSFSKKTNNKLSLDNGEY